MNSVCFQSIVGHYLVHFDDIQSGDFSTSPVSCYRFYYDGYQYWLWCLGIVRCCSCCIFSFPDDSVVLGLGTVFAGVLLSRGFR